MRRGQSHGIAALPCSVVLALVFLSCGGSDEDVPLLLGASCSEGDRCEGSELCRLGLCRSLCRMDIECPEGICVAPPEAPNARVCTLQSENDCTDDEACPPPLVCADDGACRNVCSDTFPCGSASLCLDGLCFELACGDGVVQEPEECDDGDGNSDTEPDACREDCTAARCGDGVVDSAEHCDDGDDNSDIEPEACPTTCANPACGNGELDDGEECDEGDDNSDSEPDACREDCSESHCGDGVIDEGEECDDGDDNSDTVPEACPTTCVRGTCDEGEERCEGEHLRRCDSEGRWEPLEICAVLCVVDACIPYVPSNIDEPDLELLVAGEGPLVISENVTIDTDTGLIFGDPSVLREAGEGTISGIGFAHRAQGLGDPDLGIFSVTGLTVESSSVVTVRGRAAFVFLVHGDADIQGVIDATGSTGGNMTAGAGGPGGFIGGDSLLPDGRGPGRGWSMGPSTVGDPGGGGGGGYCYPGGRGGSGRYSGGGEGGSEYGDPGLVPLVGGSGGASQERPRWLDGGGGGGGGGAVQLSATGTVAIGTGINAGGGGGGGSSRNRRPGGGGGSGGVILIEGADVSIFGTLAANGGGGGGNFNGTSGRLSSVPAVGSDEDNGAGMGGEGGAGTSVSGSVGGGNYAGGGGGGAVGRIRINVPDPDTDLTILDGAVISPRLSPVTTCSTIGRTHIPAE